MIYIYVHVNDIDLQGLSQYFCLFCSVIILYPAIKRMPFAIKKLIFKNYFPTENKDTRVAYIDL